MTHVQPVPARCLAAVLAAGLLAAGAAHASAAPDSARLAGLQTACDAAPYVRVITNRATLLARRPQLDAIGVQLSPADPHPALVTLGGGGDPARRVSWAEVERLERTDPRTARGALVGGIVGAAAGGMVRATSGPDLFEKGDNGAAWLAVALTLTGAGAGAILGALNPALHPLYP